MSRLSRRGSWFSLVRQSSVYGNSPSLHREISFPNLVIFCGNHAPFSESSPTCGRATAIFTTRPSGRGETRLRAILHTPRCQCLITQARIITLKHVCIITAKNKCDSVTCVGLNVFTLQRVKHNTSKQRDDDRQLLQLSVTRHRKQTQEQETKINSKNTTDNVFKNRHHSTSL